MGYKRECAEKNTACFYREGEFELTEDKWERILIERKRKKKALDTEDLLKLFPPA